MFKPENDLERALVTAADEPATRPAFLKRFVDSELSLALVDSGDPREGYVVPEVSHNDDAFVPIFTSDARVAAMFGDEKMMVVRQSFRQIIEQLEDANFVLNPGSDYGREFTAADVAAMLAGEFEKVSDEGGFSSDDGEEGGDLPTIVGRPQPMPGHLTKPLSALFATLPDVRAAYIAQAVFADGEGAKRLVIGLAADGDVDAVFERIEDVLSEAARPSDVIDFVAYPGSPLDGYFERDAQPFYTRG